MAAHSQSYYRALLVPDWRFGGFMARYSGHNPPDGAGQIESDASSFTEGGPHSSAPGLQTGGGTRMSLEVSGDYVSTALDDTYLWVATSRPGHATRTGAGAHFVWATGDSLDPAYGWDRPSTIVGQEVLDTSAANYGRSPHLVTIPSSGTVLCAYHTVTQTDAAPAAILTRTRKRAASTGTWASAVTVVTGQTDFSSITSTDISAQAGPCMVVLPDERVLLFVVVEDVVGNVATVHMYYSDDEGASWDLGSTTCLPAAIDVATYTIRKIRAAYLDGQISLLLHRKTTASGPTDIIIQYASDSMGGSFQQVSTTCLAGLPEVLTVGGRLIVGYVPRSGQTNALYPCWSVLGSAWQSLGVEYVATNGTKIDASLVAAAVDGSSNIDTASKLALCQDERGILFAYWGSTDVYGAMQDGTLVGTTATWERLDSGTLGVVNLAASDLLREIAACFQRGRVLLAGTNTASTSTTTDYYVGLWYLGGYTTVELPPRSLAMPGYLDGTNPAFICIPATYLPIELPQNTGWTAGGTASAEAITTSGTSWYLHIETVANQRYYDQYPTDDAAGNIAHYACRSNNTTKAQVTLLSSVGAADYRLYIAVTSTTITMENSGVVLQTAAHGAGSSFVEVRAAQNSGLCSVWYRIYTTNEEHAWTLLGDAEILTNAGAIIGSNLVRFGTVETNATYNQDWMWFGHGSGASAIGTVGLAAGAAALHGRPLSGDPVYVTNGLWLRGTGGPTIGTVTAAGAPTGDFWRSYPEYDHPISSVDPRLYPSPRDTWRSTQVAVDESIAFELEDGGRMPTDLLGVHLEGVNHPKWLVQTSSDATNYTTVLTITAYATIAWTRTKAGVEITYTSGGFTGVLREDELVGGAVMFGTTSAADIRRINRNTGGTVQSSGTPKIPRVYFDGLDGTEGTTGTGYLWFPRATGVVPLASTADVLGIRLVADVDATFLGPPEGYFECGVAVIGSVYLFGFDPELSRTRDRTAAVDITEAPDRRKRSRKRGPTARRYSVSWDGVPTGELYAGRDRHIISDGSGTPVVALRHEVPILIDGLYEHMDGPHTPGVLIPNVAATGSQVILQGPVYGRFDSDISLQTNGTKGREDADEVISVSFDWAEEV